MKNSFKNIYILGAGSMAREVLEIYRDLNKASAVSGFLEENSTRENQYIKEIPILNTSKKDALINDNIFIGAIGSPKRKIIIKKIKENGAKFDTLIHPSVLIGNDAKIHEGVIICAGSILTCNIEINSHSIINIGCTISHDVKIGEFATIAPGVNIGGNVTIGNNSWIGIGTKIIHGVRIGNNVFLGAGSVVVNDIPDNSLAYGVPAKVVRKLTKDDWDNLI